MTPDMFNTTLHAQRADLAAMRLALADLAKVLDANVSAEWLSALQARIPKAHKAALGLTQDQSQAILDLAAALARLHRSLAQQLAPKETGDD